MAPHLPDPEALRALHHRGEDPRLLERLREAVRRVDRELDRLSELHAIRPEET